ncbi:MAG: nuclear transport factor 2 family protein [Sphingobacteriaceae bacterium]|jgi:hypothetical protein|nr:nuclear transport factor 2 family protein [Sphingobacteriaceae bacterium]
MKKYLLILAIMLSANVALQAQTGETEAIRKVLNTLFDGMRKGDSALVRSVLSKDVIFQGISEKDGTTRVETADVNGFLKAIGTPHKQVWDERITFVQVLVDDKLASVWTNYKFYVGESFSHCGVDSFQLVKENDGWKIVYLVDTRRKGDCPE